QLLGRMGVDETLHMVFYRNVGAAAFDVAPDETMQAVRDEVVGFQMPGAGMRDFRRHSVIIAKAGIYDLRLHHDEVVAPVLKFWRVFDRTDLGAAGGPAPPELVTVMAGADAHAGPLLAPTPLAPPP